MSLSSVALTFSLFGAFFVLHRRRSNTSGLPLPPGPPGLPVLGNALSNLTSKPWELYSAWGKEYNSDIIHLNMAGSHIVVLNSYQACVDLLDHRSGLYSSRPRMSMFKLMGYMDWNLVVMPYGDRWRVHRRLAHQALREELTRKLRPYQLHTTHQMLKNMRDKPDDYSHHFHLMVAQVILKSVYGLNADSFGHKYVQASEELGKSSESASEYGKYLVEALPILEYVPSWFPGAKFQRDAREWRQVGDNYVEFMISEAEKQIDADISSYSFVSDNLGQIEFNKGTPEYRERRDVVRSVAAILYGAASETTNGLLMCFVHAMVLHPDVQRKARAELDSVLPHGQAPAFDQLNAEAMPYVTAVVKETIRYGSVTPLLVPHFIDSEDEYKGYRIPAKSVVFGNGWAMLHDENVYPEPERFYPERFLRADGSLNPDIQDPAAIAFGFGRRICPGRHFAYSALWIAIASLLKVFEFSCEVDASGKPIDPVTDYKYGITTYPKPFKCRIVVRASEQDTFDNLTQEENVG